MADDITKLIASNSALRSVNQGLSAENKRLKRDLRDLRKRFQAPHRTTVWRREQKAKELTQ